jgi:hypothetical protein
VADAVALRAGTSFLVAQLTALALMAAPDPIDTAGARVPESFPAGVGAAMDRYLHEVGPDDRSAQDLLGALAWTEPTLGGIGTGYERQRMTHHRAQWRRRDTRRRSPSGQGQAVSRRAVRLQPRRFDSGWRLAHLYRLVVGVGCRRHPSGLSSSSRQIHKGLPLHHIGRVRE